MPILLISQHAVLPHVGFAHVGSGLVERRAVHDRIYMGRSVAPRVSVLLLELSAKIVEMTAYLSYISSNSNDLNSTSGLTNSRLSGSLACYAVAGRSSTRPPFSSVRLDTGAFHEKSLRLLPKSNSA